MKDSFRVRLPSSGRLNYEPERRGGFIGFRAVVEAGSAH